MCSVVIRDARNVTIPEWVKNLESFSRWVETEEFPEEGRIEYLAGEIWIDMSEEQLFSHNQVKLEFTIVVGGMVKSDRLGRFFPDGVRLNHPEVDLAVVPDAVFISNDCIQNMRVHLVPGASSGYIRLEGSPDMVLEVVSDGSVRKDTELSRQLYWQAGIPEYWLVDARRETISFEILRRSAKGYVSSRKQDGWVKSVVFGKSFRLIRAVDALDHPTFTLEVR